MTRTLDREAFRRCLAIEPWEQDAMDPDEDPDECTTTVGEVLASAPTAPGSTIEPEGEGGAGDDPACLRQ